MDVHVRRAIPVSLRLRGVDVLTAQGDGAARFSDRELLNRAGELNRVLFSQDADLLREAIMMEGASGFHEDRQPGRWVLETKRDTRAWEVVVEPDSEDRLLVVITAYPLDQL